MIWLIFFILFLVLIALILLMIAYERYVSKMNVIQAIFREYTVHILAVIFLFALIIPLILYGFGLFKNDRALHNSDVLGYYGAIIGGGVTVLGIYWTFKNERLKSEEDRKRESLPLLKFTYTPNHTGEKGEENFQLNYFEEDTGVVTRAERPDLVQDGILNIKNIGLQAAVILDFNILSRPTFRSPAKMSNVEKALAFNHAHITITKGGNINLGVRLSIEKFTRDHTLEVIYCDIYKNIYKYELEFTLKGEYRQPELEVEINPNNNPIYPIYIE